MMAWKTMKNLSHKYIKPAQTRAICTSHAYNRPLITFKRLGPFSWYPLLLESALHTDWTSALQ